MRNKILTGLAVSFFGVLMAMPLAAQSFTLRANIPFQFVVEGKTMPAGTYLVRRKTRRVW